MTNILSYFIFNVSDLEKSYYRLETDTNYIKIYSKKNLIYYRRTINLELAIDD